MWYANVESSQYIVQEIHQFTTRKNMSLTISGLIRDGSIRQFDFADVTAIARSARTITQTRKGASNVPKMQATPSSTIGFGWTEASLTNPGDIQVGVCKAKETDKFHPVQLHLQKPSQIKSSKLERKIPPILNHYVISYQVLWSIIEITFPSMRWKFIFLKGL